jgi:hypothetical protein
MILKKEQTIVESVAAGLNSLAEWRADAVGAGRWMLDTDRRGDMRIAAALWEDQWLQFTAPIPRGRIHGAAVQRCAWDLLNVNGSLSGAAKIILPPVGKAVAITREIWLDPESFEAEPVEAIALLTRMAIDDLTEGTAALLGRKHLGERESGPGGATDQVDLAELCQLAGWPSNQRSGGRIAVPLDVPGSYAQAIVIPRSRIRAAVEFPLEQQRLSAQSRQAVGVLLLRLAGCVRWIRGAVHVEDGRELAVLEGQLDTAPCAAGLNHLLSALSVGARMVMRELPALACPQTAEKYLSIRGWSP